MSQPPSYADQCEAQIADLRRLLRAAEERAQKAERARDLLRRLVTAQGRVLVAYRLGTRSPGRAIDEAENVREELRTLGEEPPL